MSDFYLEKNISPDDKARIAGNACDLIDRLSNEKRWKISVKENKETRSIRQNAYLWGVVYPSIRNFEEESTGELYTCEEIHEVCKEMFVNPEVKTVMGMEVTLYRSTKKMNKAEFSLYLERIAHTRAEKGHVVPLPEWDWRVAE